MYQDGTAAKLGIYCGTIEKLEKLVYPLVARIAGEYGLSADCILKFHKGNKQYPQPADSQMQFDTLDHPISKIEKSKNRFGRIICVGNIRHNISIA